MFYIWHTLLVLVFIVISFVLGYNYGKKSKEYKITYTKETKTKCPMGFN
jgi:preprotein translocase subunit SecG